MKILFITPIPPSDYSGGGLAVKQSLLSLIDFCDVHYIGPEFDNETLTGALNCISIIQPQSKLFSIYNLFRGNTSSYYNSLTNLLKKLSLADYDACFLEFTRFDFIVKELPLDLKLIIRIHNIEAEYFSAKFRTNKNLKNLIRYIYSKKQEQKLISRADSIITLTEEENLKVRTIYHYSKESKVIPICIQQQNKGERVESAKINILVTGSLWFGTNVNGIVWFLENVLAFLPSQNYVLTIAGSNPSKQIIDKVGHYSDKYNIELHPNPKDMNLYFSRADFVIAPVFEGAGMKVKVAEALSYGLPVLASHHAAIGYQNSKAILCSDSAVDWISNIESLSSSKVNLEQLSKVAMNCFIENYSLSNSTQKYSQVLIND